MMIDLLAPEILANPYPTYNKMREKEPVCEIHPGGVWVISRYNDVLDALKNQSLFTSRKNVELFSPSWLKKECKSDLYIMTQDEKKYRSRRSMISPPFLKKSVMHFENRINAVAIDVRDTIMKKKNFEFIESFSYPYTMNVLEEIIGIEELEGLDDLQHWIQAVERVTVPNLDKQAIIDIERTILHQKNTFAKFIDTRRRQGKLGKNNFITRLLFDEIDGKPLTTNQLVNIIELLIRTALQTTVHLLANAIIVLIYNSNIRRMLSKTSLIPAFVNELLRLDSSLPFAIRHSTQDIILHNKLIPKNSLVLLSIAAANRDPRKFCSPNEYNLYREGKNQHIAFGYGPHKCMGLHIAKLEVEIALKHLLPLIESMSCPKKHDLMWIKTHLFRGLESLPISINTGSTN